MSLTNNFNKIIESIDNYNKKVEDLLNYHTEQLELELEAYNNEKVLDISSDDDIQITYFCNGIEYHFISNKNQYWIVNNKKYKTICNFKEKDLENLTMKQYRWYTYRYPKNKHLPLIKN